MITKWLMSVTSATILAMPLFAIGDTNFLGEILRFARWPTSDVQLSTAISNSISIVTAVSTNPPEISDRHVVHMSTSMAVGDGETIEGGGYVHYARCRQKFQVLLTLLGKKTPESVTIDYSFTERSDALPGPKAERAVPMNEKVILILGEGTILIKVLPDTDENRTVMHGIQEKRLKEFLEGE